MPYVIVAELVTNARSPSQPTNSSVDPCTDYDQAGLDEMPLRGLSTAR